MKEAENQTGKVNVSTEGSSVYTIKVTKNTEDAAEKRYSGRRGKDKRPRRITENSLLNLKPFQSVLDTSLLRQYTRNSYQKPSSSWKFWIVLLIILGIIIGVYFIWKYYKERREKSYNSDNSPDSFDITKTR